MDEEDRREELEAELEEETDQAFQWIVDGLYESIDREYGDRRDLMEEIGITPGGWREGMAERVGMFLLNGYQRYQKPKEGKE